ncbi:MAG TPA: SRPBCC family protein [Solirubrobacteraceae bacterium]|nr:SRPBCC family protein [Solirubrobacteraceae bacterium]
MPTARRSRTISAPPQELWELIGDPHHLPRWWPRVTRVEDVEDGAFTEVFATRKGHLVRADFDLVYRDEAEHTLRWSQRVEGTPFGRVLRSAETEVRLTPSAAPHGPGAGGDALHGPGPGGDDGPPGRPAATEVTIEVRQALAGFFARFGSFMIRRAAAHTIDEALDGLARISG